MIRGEGPPPRCMVGRGETVDRFADKSSNHPLRLVFDVVSVPTSGFGHVDPFLGWANDEQGGQKDRCDPQYAFAQNIVADRPADRSVTTADVDVRGEMIIFDRLRVGEHPPLDRVDIVEAIHQRPTAAGDGRFQYLQRIFAHSGAAISKTAPRDHQTAVMEDPFFIEQLFHIRPHQVRFVRAELARRGAADDRRPQFECFRGGVDGDVQSRERTGTPDRDPVTGSDARVDQQTHRDSGEVRVDRSLLRVQVARQTGHHDDFNWCHPSRAISSIPGDFRLLGETVNWYARRCFLGIA